VYHTHVNYEYGGQEYDNVYIGTVSLKHHIFVLLSIYVLNGLVIGATVFGFFFLIWIDACIRK